MLWLQTRIISKDVVYPNGEIGALQNNGYDDGDAASAAAAADDDDNDVM